MVVQVVTLLAYYNNNPSLNPARVFNICSEKFFQRAIKKTPGKAQRSVDYEDWLLPREYWPSKANMVYFIVRAILG